VLGFKDRDPKLDLKVDVVLPRDTARVLVAPVTAYADDAPPDVVVLRAFPDQVRRILDTLGWENFNEQLAGRLDCSALEVFKSGGESFDKKRVQAVNTLLAGLNRSEAWRDFTKWIFDRQWTTYVFNLLLERYLANMSICRNSTVIPYLTGKANVSYFCTGGIAWGLNKPRHMTCGMPFDLYRKLDVDW